MRFKGKRVIVTGGSSGIGEAIVRRFWEEGASVMISDISAEKGEALAAELSRNGQDIFFCQTDVGDPVSVERSIRTAVERFGGLDVLVNNAGIGQPDAITEDIPIELFRKILDVNLFGVFYNAKYALTHLRESKGCIVNTASITGILATTHSGAYGASKGGVISLTRSIAFDYARLGVRCNAIAPSACDTPLWQSLPTLSEEERVEVIRRESWPTCRFSTPTEVANAVLFLASEEAAYVNGVILPVDGGFTASGH